MVFDQSDIQQGNDCPHVWSSLIKWVRENGGEVHPHLNLQVISDDVNNRGIFASQPIKQGDTLIRIPPELVLCGRQLPKVYKKDNEQRSVSSWLRCLAAYYKAEKDPFWEQYMASLPSAYETLWQWTDHERSQYLAGTSIPLEEFDNELIRGRYETQIRPYLVTVGVLETADETNSDELSGFATACQAIRTRCFHLEATEMVRLVTSATEGESVGDDSGREDDYDGPYFLPVMDLLNHGSASLIHTVIRREPNRSLIMKAERDIEAGAEVLHSYAHSAGLTAAEFLLTFGFVADDRIHHACSIKTHCLPSLPVSCCLISTQQVFEACWHVIESGIAKSLEVSLGQAGCGDETWSLEVDKSRLVEYLESRGPDDRVAIQYEPDSSDSLWSNELVTLACLPFLPPDAYEEAKDSVLDKSILEDYFLGKLVCSALLHVLDQRKQSYSPIAYRDQERVDDIQLLKELEACHLKHRGDIRLQSGLVVRIEETASLEALRRQIIITMSQLDDDDVSTESNRSNGPNNERSYKRLKG